MAGIKLRKDRFSVKLAKKLEHLGTIEEDGCDDDSARWVELRIGSNTLYFSFDPKGEKIEYISLHEDVVQIVDEKRLWKSK
jgi:hypothetical protein